MDIKLTQRLDTGRQAYTYIDIYVNMAIVNLHMHVLAGVVVEGLIESIHYCIVYV